MTHRTASRLAAGLTLVAGLAAASAAFAAPVQGETVFKQQCGTCHTIAPGAAKLGPPLKGMIGRKAGTVPGYAYSNALKAWGQTWTTANLDQYLAKPTATVPGTKMLVGVSNAEQRAAVVAYLAAQK
ncbi:cytochrome C [Phenylobacterium sp. Root77]|nr:MULTISPECIES: c-type cytochrome [unclassified Phenylobacterium]KQW69464.1 cytochrome C [Phenylobacterium sp. Root1277]KQW96019.1 cytochrome C [Phenylobacterium sp. Root1290]KRC41808.1 cytochrome C [Phenylobacterium sp. Root77]